jgi:hypothetical protein
MNEGMIFWTPGITLENVEEQVIKAAFKFYHSNKTATANALKISIRTLDSKLEKYEHDAKLRSIAADQQRARDRDYLERARGPKQINGFATSTPQKDEQIGGGATDMHGAAAGLCLEPTKEAAPEQQVPVPIKQEVQKVLPQQPAARSSQRAR